VPGPQTSDQYRDAAWILARSDQSSRPTGA